VLRCGWASKTVERVVTVGSEALAPPAVADSVHRLWAQSWIAELSKALKPDERAISDLGKRYGVVTAGTSLLVLDRIEDYVRYRVEPKEPELLAEYRRMIEGQPKPAVDQASRDWNPGAGWQGVPRLSRGQHPGVETVLVPMKEAVALAQVQQSLAGLPRRSTRPGETGRCAGAALADRGRRGGLTRCVGTRSSADGVRARSAAQAPGSAAAGGRQRSAQQS
jgi:hypothetical protein